MDGLNRCADLERIHKDDCVERRYRSWLEGEWAPRAVGGECTGRGDSKEVLMMRDNSAVDWLG